MMMCEAQPISWTGTGDDPKVVCLTLPEGMSWLTMKSRHFFVRSRYEELWGKVDALFCLWKEDAEQSAKEDAEQTQPIQRVLVLGNTGIGKTVSLNYFLRRALEKEYRVLFETREMRYFFHDGTVEWEQLSSGKLGHYRSNRSVLLLVDHQQGQPPPFCAAFTVAPVSPDPANYKEWRKNRCFQLWMPLTTRSEVLAMNKIEPRLKDGLLRDLLAEFGPIPRQLFEKNREAAKKLLLAKVASFDFGKCRTLGMLDSGELPESKEGLSWWVLHVTTEDLLVASKINWATPWVMHKVLERYRGQKLADLEHLVADELSRPASLHEPDGEFEYWACHKIASGCKVKVWDPFYEKGKCKLNESTGWALELAANDVVLTSRIVDVADLVTKPGVMFYSQSVNQPLCDAAVVFHNELLLFQMTIGKEHGLSKTTLDSYCKAAKDAQLDRVRFIFVVPFRNKFSVSLDQVQLSGKFEKDFVSLHVAELSPSLYH
jgi:hypothetical protein